MIYLIAIASGKKRVFSDRFVSVSRKQGVPL